MSQGTSNIFDRSVGDVVYDRDSQPVLVDVLNPGNPLLADPLGPEYQAEPGKGEEIKGSKEIEIQDDVFISWTFERYI